VCLVSALFGLSSAPGHRPGVAQGATGRYDTSLGTASAGLSSGVVDLTSAIRAVTPPGLTPDPVYRISCRAKFCMILAGGVAIPFNGKFGKAGYAFGSYSAVHAPVRGPGALLACSAAVSCMAASQDGQTAMWNGSGWSVRPRINGGSVTSLACASSNRCFAITADGAAGQAMLATFNGRAWTQAAFNNDGQVLTQIQCASAAYCLMLGNDGDVWTWAARHWSPARTVTVADAQSQHDPISSMSCAPGPFCLGVGSVGGGVAIDRGRGFIGSSVPALRGNPACGTASFCLVSRLSSGPIAPAIFNSKSVRPVPAAAAVFRDGTTFLACGDRLCLNSPFPSDEVVIYRAG
jgi:hypothetical protein